MEGSGNGDSIVTVSAPINKSGPYTELFTIKVSDDLYETIIVNRHSKPTFNLNITLKSSYNYPNDENDFGLSNLNYDTVLDFGNCILHDIEGATIDRLVDSDGNYLCVAEGGDLSNFQINLFGLDSGNPISIGQATTNSLGECSFTDITLNRYIQTIISKNGYSRETLLTIDDYEINNFTIYIQ